MAAIEFPASGCLLDPGLLELRMYASDPASDRNDHMETNTIAAIVTIATIAGRVFRRS